MSPADKALFQQWITHRDAEAFTRLARQYSGLVYAAGWRITGNTHDAEDVAQVAFQKLSAQRHPPKAPLGAWLHRVATNQALSLLKSRGRRRAREARYQQLQPQHTEIAWKDVYDLVDAAIAALPEKQRYPIVAHYLEGQTHEAIAKELGITRSAVTQRIRSGVAAIRKGLQKHGVTAPLAALSGLMVEDANAAAPASLMATLGKIALSGHTHKAGGIGALWQAWVAGLGGANGLVAGVIVVLAVVVAFTGFRSTNPNTVPGVAAVSTPPQTAPIVGTAVVDSGDPAAIDTQIATRSIQPDTSASAPTMLVANAQGARIFGRVVDTAGRSVAGAQVQLSGTEDLRQGSGWVTDENGQFEFLHVVPAEQCWVGSYKTEDGRTARGNQAELASVLPGEAYGVVLTLFDGVISGRVLDAAARPMPGVEVLASPQWWYRFGLPTATTGEDGRYHIAGVMAGEYEMQIKAAKGSYIETGVQVRSDGISVRAEVNLTYAKPPGATIAGRVTNAEGEPIERAHVKLNLTVAPHTSVWVFTDVDGYYELHGVPVGPNLATAQHWDYGDQYKRDVASDEDSVNFVLPYRGTVDGQVVHAETGVPITDFEMHTWEATSDIDYFMGAERWKPHTDPEGRFSIVLKPGDQPLRIRAKGFGEVNQTVTVPAGGTLQDLRVALKPAGVLRGIVANATDGTPVAGARIYRGKLPTEALRVSSVAAVSDELGRFTLNDTSPDGELLTASHPAFAPAWSQTEPGDTEVALAMPAGTTIKGSVSVNGIPAEGMVIHAVAPSFSDTTLAQAISDVDGGFTMSGLPQTDFLLYTRIDSPQERTQYFQPGSGWRMGRDPVLFDFIQQDAGIQMTVRNETQPQSGLLIQAFQDLGGGFSDVVTGHLNAEGRTLFQELSEGPWEIRVYPPGASDARGADAWFANAQSGTIQMIEHDLAQPDVVSENMAFTPSPDTPPPAQEERSSTGLRSDVP